MDDPRLRTLRPSSLEVRRVVGRPDLPDLLLARDASPWPLPLLRQLRVTLAALSPWQADMDGFASPGAQGDGRLAGEAADHGPPEPAGAAVEVGGTFPRE